MKKNISKIIFSFLGLGVVGVIFTLMIVLYFSLSLPDITNLNDYNPPIPSRILAKDGTVLAELGKEKREIVKFKDIPSRVTNAFLAAEDDGFYEHKGVDYLGVARAMLANLKAGKVVQGGSTITQQVAKSLLLTSERSISRKIKDFLLAQKIEERFSKQEILFLYLNQVYLGGGYYGIQKAFHGYFGKDLDEATIAESAMIAGLLVAPSRYSPYRRPKFAKARQFYVLKRMFVTGKITQHEYDEAKNEKIKYRLKVYAPFRAGHFTDRVRQEVVSILGEKEFLTGGYTVQTTIDTKLQMIAEREVLKGVKAIDRRQGFHPLGKKIDISTLSKRAIAHRINVYQKKSNFFTLNEEKEKEYELRFHQEDWDEREKKRMELSEKISHGNFPTGNFKEDPFLKQIKKETVYEAVVTEVNNLGRVIYVDIAGLKGIIPYENFRWAHERKILDTHRFYPYVTRPSTIVSIGDIIHVEIQNKSTTPWKHLWSSFRKKHKEVETLKYFKKQRFLLCFLSQLPTEEFPRPEGGLVSISPLSGEVLSYVGGADFSHSQFNRVVQSKRQPGSSFKPFIYAAALENGFTPSSIILDSPEALGGAEEGLNWKPKNYDNKFKGPITLRTSIELSRNVTLIKIAQKVGVDKIIDFAKRLGIKAKLERDLSIALGSFGITIMDIVSAYAIFPSGGKRVTPKFIMSIHDRHGVEVPLSSTEDTTILAINHEIEEPYSIIHSKKIKEVIEDQNPYHKSLDEVQVYDERLAFLMTNLLKGVIWHGTGRPARTVSRALGGKTGTTSSFIDAWFIGFSHNVVTGVWTGMDDNTTMGYAEHGTRAALPIWTEYMRATVAKYGDHDFPIPLGISNMMIDKVTGLQAKADTERSFLESFVEGTGPGISSKVESSEKDDGNLLEDDDFYNQN